MRSRHANFANYLGTTNNLENNREYTVIERIKNLSNKATRLEKISDQELSSLLRSNIEHYSQAELFAKEFIEHINHKPHEVKDAFIDLVKKIAEDLLEPNDDIQKDLKTLLKKHDFLTRLQSANNLNEVEVKVKLLNIYIDKHIRPQIRNAALDAGSKKRQADKIMTLVNKLFSSILSYIEEGKARIDAGNDEIYNILTTLQPNELEADGNTLLDYTEDRASDENFRKSREFELTYDTLPDYFMNILNDTSNIDNDAIQEYKHEYKPHKNAPDFSQAASDQSDVLLEDLDRDLLLNTYSYRDKGKDEIKAILIDDLGKDKFSRLKKYYIQDTSGLAQHALSMHAEAFRSGFSVGKTSRSLCINNDKAIITSTLSGISYYVIDDVKGKISYSIPGHIVLKAELDLSADHGYGFVFTKLAASNQVLTDLLTSSGTVHNIKELKKEAAKQENINNDYRFEQLLKEFGNDSSIEDEVSSSSIESLIEKSTDSNGERANLNQSDKAEIVSVKPAIQNTSVDKNAGVEKETVTHKENNDATNRDQADSNPLKPVPPHQANNTATKKQDDTDLSKASVTKTSNTPWAIAGGTLLLTAGALVTTALLFNPVGLAIAGVTSAALALAGITGLATTTTLAIGLATVIGIPAIIMGSSFGVCKALESRLPLKSVEDRKPDSSTYNKLFTKINPDAGTDPENTKRTRKPAMKAEAEQGQPLALDTKQEKKPALTEDASHTAAARNR